MRLAWAVLACMVLASGARSAPDAAAAACRSRVENRVQAVFMPNGISPQAKAKLLADAKENRLAQLKACQNAGGSAIRVSPETPVKPK